jgi:predicted aspartyl protease
MRVLLLALGLLAASVSAAAASGDSKCRLQRITELPIWIEHGRPVTVGTLNGRKIGVLIDTGSGPSFVERLALERLGVPGFRDVALRPFGGSGDGAGNVVQIDEFRLGRTVRKDWRVLVSPEDSFGSDIAVSLGAEFFRNVDVEFDFPNAALRLYQAEHCAQAALSYWTEGGPANEVPIERSTHVRLTLQINGRPVRAQLDSGASQSVIDSRLAAPLGVTRRSPGVVDGGCSAGLGRNPIETWIAPLKLLEIGDEQIRSPKMRFGELSANVVARAASSELQRLPEMLLGVDFLRSHRVLVANSQRKIYFTYSGGPVFPPTVAETCGIRS